VTGADNLASLTGAEPEVLFDAFAQVARLEKRTTRKGDPFWVVELRDVTGSVTSNVWHNSPVFSAVEDLVPGDIVKLRAVASVDERYGRQLEIRKVRTINPEDEGTGFDPALVVVSSRFDRPQLLDELQEYARNIARPLLSRLVLDVLSEYEEALLVHPAAARLHHPFLGGLVEHTWSVTKTCVFLAEKYSDYYGNIDSDLVTAGAILHDIGKLRELTAHHGTASYSVEGRLLGHMLLGRDIVREHAGAIEDFPQDVLLALEHIIIAHQGRLEWGSPIEPLSPECLIVHYADDLDAKLNMMMCAIEEDTTDGPFTPYNGKLKRRVFKGPDVIAPDAPERE